MSKDLIDKTVGATVVNSRKVVGVVPAGVERQQLDSLIQATYQALTILSVCR